MSKTKSKNSKQTNGFLIFLGIFLLIAALFLTFALHKKAKGTPNKVLQTKEQEITLPTAEKGEKESYTDSLGNVFVVKEDGVYKKSDYGEGYEKMDNLKIIPLFGNWTSKESDVQYTFNSDKTFKISVPFITGEETYWSYYEGEIRLEPIDRFFVKLQVNSIKMLLEKMGIEKEKFIEKNFYPVTLKYNTIKNSADNSVYQATAEDFKEGTNENEGVFEGYVYTFWDEKENCYKAKFYSANKKTNVVYEKMKEGK